MNDPLQFFGDDLIAEVGRIAVLRGWLRSTLTGMISTLLCNERPVPGVASAMFKDRGIPDLLSVLITTASARGVPTSAIDNLKRISVGYHEDFTAAAAIANGAWSLLGGEPARYGLSLGQQLEKSGLVAQWRSYTVGDLAGLGNRLIDACKLLPGTATWNHITRSEAEGGIADRMEQ
jgi:hypothetical protein